MNANIGNVCLNLFPFKHRSVFVCFKENATLRAIWLSFCLLFQLLKYSMREYIQLYFQHQFFVIHSRQFALAFTTVYLHTEIFAFSTSQQCYLLQAAPQWLKNYLKSFCDSYKSARGYTLTLVFLALHDFVHVAHKSSLKISV